MVLFAHPDHYANNRHQALGMSAAKFIYRWEDLIAMIETLVKSYWVEQELF